MIYDTAVYQYSVRDWPLAGAVSLHFKYPLELLHEKQTEQLGRLEVGKDQQTEFHKHFYTLDDSFWQRYTTFVQEICCPIAGVDPQDVVYQRRPTFRVHLPGNVATGGWHRDGDYNHPSAEVNFVLPLTNFLAPSPEGHAGNGFFIEHGDDYRLGKTFISPKLVVGDLLRFRGSTLLHGSVENRTGWTRVSLDFRLLPKSDLAAAADKATVNQRRPFTVGTDGYYAEFPKS